jgi:hypothetical protein
MKSHKTGHPSKPAIIFGPRAGRFWEVSLYPQDVKVIYMYIIDKWLGSQTQFDMSRADISVQNTLFRSVTLREKMQQIKTGTPTQAAWISNQPD